MDSENQPVTTEWFDKAVGGEWQPVSTANLWITETGLYVNGNVVLRWKDRAHCRQMVEAFGGKCLEPPPLVLIQQKDSRKQPYDPAGQEYPANLNTQEFRDTWIKWVEYRKTVKRNGGLTKLAAVQNLTILSRFGADVAIAAIELSIANQWTGLFPENVLQRGQSNARQQPNSTEGYVYREPGVGEQRKPESVFEF